MQTRVKKVLLVLLISIGLPLLDSFATNSCIAVPLEQIQNPRKLNKETWVTDQANKLAQDAEDSINAKLTQLQKEKGVEVAVVIVQDITPESSIEAYATKLFNRWGIGKKGTNNGVLFLWATDSRKVRIEVGTGLQGVIPNALAQSIINNKAIPEFKKETSQGNEQGVKRSIDAIVNAIHTDGFAHGFETILPFLPYIIGGPLLIIILVTAYSGSSSGGGSDGGGFSSGSGGSSSGGGSDGGGFGGGSSDGGGASGSY